MQAHHLATERTRFLGRSAELATLEQWLAGSRLVSLVGPGGVGKTRLVRELGRRLAGRFPGGAWFCDVSSAYLRSELVLEVARAAALPLETGGELSPRVLAWLRAKGPVLLLLDNAEQLVSDAVAQLAAWVEDAPQLHVVATSRAPLAVDGERVFPVAPLSVDEAVALFVERGAAWDQRVGPAPAVHEVVERLDRLPLAIELAAARLDLFSLDELRERLVRHAEVLAPEPPGTPLRHGMLKATIAWSWSLLSDEERRACEDLSVFEGGASLAVVALAWGGEPVALSRLGGLRRKSLLFVVDGPDRQSRYVPYEAVRSFAKEQLDASGRRGAAELAHARALAELCEG